MHKPARKSLSVLAGYGTSGYYDATSNLPHRDFGFFQSLDERAFFNCYSRAVAISRLRREVRNNPYLAGIVAEFPRAMGTGELRSRSSDREYNAKKELIWYRYCKRVTTDGRSNRRMQKTRWHEMLVAGEVFWIQMANGRLQMVPSEFCGSPTGESDRMPGEIDGIVYNRTGTPTHYRFGKQTEFGTMDFESGELIEARFVIHDFSPDRIRMGRGLPWLLTSLVPARDLYEITRAKTKQIKDANKFTGAIESDAGAGVLQKFAGLRGFDPTAPAPFSGDEGDPADEAADLPASAQGTVLELKDGTFVVLDPGEKLHLLQTKYEAVDYKELIMIMLHAVSAPLGLPVELWFSGLGDVNFSGFKGLGTQWANRRRDYIEDFEETFLDRWHFWRQSKYVKEGDMTPHPDADEDLIEWAWRHRAVVDEEREAKANQTKIDTGQELVTDAWERSGLFFDEVFGYRRNVYIELLRASGQIADDADPADIEVPIEFLYRGKLPAELAPAAAASPTTESQDESDRAA